MRLTNIVDPAKCAGCVQVVERRKWCCLRCWSKLPEAVRAAIVRAASFRTDEAATRCQRILERQAVQYWRGGKPRGFLWREGARL